MAKEKTPKTNAMRILDRLKISYEVLSYQCDEFTQQIHLGFHMRTALRHSFFRERARDTVYLFFQSRKN